MTYAMRVGTMLVLASLAFALSALLVTAGSTVAGSAVRARAMPPSEVSEEPVLDCARHGQLARSQYDGKGTAVTALGGLPKRPSTILPREEVCGDPEVGATLSGPPERSAPSAVALARTTTPRALAIPRGAPLTVTRDENDVELAVIEAAREFGQDPQQLLRVARCESPGYRMAVVGRAQEIGALQFLPSTFAANAPRLGYTVLDITDAVAQARVAAEMFSREQAWQWSCK